MEPKTLSDAKGRSRSILSVAIFAAAVALMAYLRLYLFHDRFISLTYGLPLLVCLWHKDLRLLWSMAGTFTVMAAIKAFWILPDANPNDWAEFVQWLMQVTNTVVIASAVHVIIRLMASLHARNAELAGANAQISRQNEELLAREEEISRQNDELQSQSEELAQQNEELQQQTEEMAQQTEEMNRQNEELQQQTEELEQQGEELQAQSEELRTANEELNQRESMLATVLTSLRDVSDEREGLQRICQSLLPLLGGSAAAAAVVEQVDDQLVVRTQANMEDLLLERWPLEQSFARIVMKHGQTAFLDDLAARPDLVIPQPKRQAFRSILATPLRLHGKAIGAVEAYAAEPRRWTTEDFRIIEWVASQCSILLELMRAQETVRLSERRYSSFVKASAQAVWTTDPQGQVILDIPAWQALTGQTAEQAHGYGWMNAIHADDRDRVAEAWRKAYESKGIYEVEYRLHIHDGTWRDILARGVPVPAADGTIREYIGTCIDVTERKQAEQALRDNEARFRSLADAIPQLAWMAEADGFIFWYNRRWYEYTGTTPQQMEGWGWQSVHDPEILPQVLERWKASIATGQPFDMEFPLRGADGRFRWFLTRVMPLKDDQGRVVRWFGTNTDISEKREADEAIREAARALRELNETLEKRVAERTAEAEHRANQLQRLAGELTQAEQRERQRLATILHDHLQQLLVGAKFHLDILHSQAADGQFREGLRHVDNLLDQSLTTSRSLTAELSPPILHDGTFAQVLHWLVRWAQEKHALAVDVRADEQVNVQDRNVRILLFQAIRELLLNVRKHAKVNQACIRMKRDAAQMEIIVSDEGVGFDPTARHDKGSNGNGSGSGFGLFSIAERLELLAGRMEIVSRPGRGTRVRLVAPLAASVPEAAVVSAPLSTVGLTDDKQPSPRRDSQKIRVLLADDHAVVRDGLARLLGMQPDIVVVGQAEDGVEAVDKTLHLRPDIVLMDVSMPNLGGVEATRRILRELPDTRVIGLSMHTQEDVAAEMIAAGAAAYLTKTSQPPKLLAAIREYSGRKSDT